MHAFCDLRRNIVEAISIFARQRCQSDVCEITIFYKQVAAEEKGRRKRPDRMTLKFSSFYLQILNDVSLT